MGTTQSAEEVRRQKIIEGPVNGFSRLMASFAPLFAVWLTVFVHRMQYAWDKNKYGEEEPYLAHDNLHIHAKQTIDPLTLIGINNATYNMDKGGLHEDYQAHTDGLFGALDAKKIYKKPPTSATQILFGVADEEAARTAVTAQVLLGCQARRFAQIARQETWILRPLLAFLLALSWFFTFMYDYVRDDMPFSLRDDGEIGRSFEGLYGPDNWYFAHLINVIIFLAFVMAALVFHYHISRAACSNAPDSRQRVDAFMRHWASDASESVRRKFREKYGNAPPPGWGEYLADVALYPARWLLGYR